MLYLIDPRGAVWQSADYTLAKAVARQRVDGRPVDDLPRPRPASRSTPPTWPASS